MKIKLTGMTFAAGLLAPLLLLAAPVEGSNVMYIAGGDAADVGSAMKDLDAQLADARARLEEAAREVAELSSRMSGPLVDHIMSIYQDGPPHAVLGVQLDERTGKDGARVEEVSPGGPAAEAGLKAGDVIISVNGEDVKGDHPARQVMHAMRDVQPDTGVELKVLRAGKTQDFVVTARPAMAFRMHPRPPIPRIAPIPPVPPDPTAQDGWERFGATFIRGPLGEMELVSITPRLGKYFGTDKGVLVVRAPKGLGLEDGDVILAIDGREPASGSHATRILGSYRPGEKIDIEVMRQQKAVNVKTTLPDDGLPARPGRAVQEGREGDGRPDGKVRLQQGVTGKETATWRATIGGPTDSRREADAQRTDALS